MRMTSLFAAFALMWAAAIGTPEAVGAPKSPPISELPICVVPMGPTVWPVDSCPDRSSSQPGDKGESASQ